MHPLRTSFEYAIALKSYSLQNHFTTVSCTQNNEKVYCNAIISNVQLQLPANAYHFLLSVLIPMLCLFENCYH